MSKYLIKKEEIDRMEGLSKTHFLNDNARRVNKSLGDLTGLTGIGFHMIDIPRVRIVPSCMPISMRTSVFMC